MLAKYVNLMGTKKKNGTAISITYVATTERAYMENMTSKIDRILTADTPMPTNREYLHPMRECVCVPRDKVG